MDLNRRLLPDWQGLMIQVASLDLQLQVTALLPWLVDCLETVTLWPVKGFAGLGADSRICDTVSCPSTQTISIILYINPLVSVLSLV
jgi:hypothetical protein